ncbi:3-deoxy-D-manno-octulosonic acid transferase [Psychrobacter sp. GP33]|uniref:3-deoxy-D-manno-octulosonic acid transferase n=1 Tax=Psychrobacter sp. GP33 TaxID=2758709 RepID=UPI0015F7FF5C|nr:3-deoxy-D-manno-octulosonic acid transferase [Psychrobacter sp. GP33]
MPSSSPPFSSTSKDAAPLQLRARAISPPPWYYRLIIGLLKPLYRLQVWRRSHQRDNYQQEVAQRFGKSYPSHPISNNAADNNVIWCHAVSLGETNTVAPLLDQLLQQGYQIWLTNTTQTGFARGASRFADAIAHGKMSHSYVPVDSPAVIKTFLAHVQPVAVLFVETELWANILYILAQRKIPSILVNGRLSAASFSRYQKISAVSRSMMQNLTLIIAQDDDSAQRFCQLGAETLQVQVAGSLKWVINAPKINHGNEKPLTKNDNENSALQKDIAIKPSLRDKKTSSNSKALERLNRPLWVAASTHSGEEEIALSWQQQLLMGTSGQNPLLILVPRHPERFDEVATLIQQSGLTMARRSMNEVVTSDTQVYLADSMGELMTWFALADVALVGGSLVDIGGHNPVEPASVGTPILMGRYTQSCQTVVDKLAGVGALYQPYNDFYRPIVVDSLTAEQGEAKPFVQIAATDDNAFIYEQLQFWLSEPTLAKQAGQSGAELAEQEQSVLPRQLQLIEAVIAQFSDKEPVL